MPRPIQAVIHGPALANNLQVVRRHAADSRVWAVIKANAYGHGIERAYEGLRQADGFGLLDLDEAVRLRQLGWQGPILLLEGFFKPEDLALVEQYRLTTTVHCEEQLRMLELARLKGPVSIQLKINTGMSRLGFAPAAYRAAWEHARAISGIGTIVHMTHFSDADGPRGIDHQLAAFEQATQGLPGEASLSNSAATLWHPRAHRDWVRPGVILYGASPTGVAADIEGTGLMPAMTLKSELIAVQDLQPGATIGYGSRFEAEQPMRIGIVACGYADGYPRHAPGWDGNYTPVLVDGVRTRMVGRVSMDMITVDLAEVPGARVGASVTLWGQGLPIDEVAHAAGTVGYELMCALAPRVPVTVEPVGTADAGETLGKAA
ncbi:alanine racemase [Ralstonia pseudosolanacearum]|uniref:alanine racemase n=1 Tax=Ralstonia pseudosolanacearum TaxID=1310165 RepID=UPI0007D80BC5|nr:alanine racemase [Ralstonia pseudosolanacearum]MDC6296066.1 alanine racemase [Ralstonia pseudosolanacearum]MDD7791712.1 alanine racemase [Ralstonia pseudosolanacearum]MDN3365962.1 alanine racemase [Ralstonia pseudosolanacearum]OAK92055.1 alanine racemase [Ralstonia pseudosolanacearum]QOK86872.1 alanine racemase [Ralstonia pseudosolanacearum]